MTVWAFVSVFAVLLAFGGLASIKRDASVAFVVMSATVSGTIVGFVLALTVGGSILFEVIWTISFASALAIASGVVVSAWRRRSDGRGRMNDRS